MQRLSSKAAREEQVEDGRGKGKEYDRGTLGFFALPRSWLPACLSKQQNECGRCHGRHREGKNKEKKVRVLSHVLFEWEW